MTALQAYEDRGEPAAALELPDGLVELDERTTAGITVRLLWSPRTARVFVAVTEGDDAPMFAAIPAERARDAFEHPYCFLPRLEVTS